MIQILVGDALEQLRTLPDESVQCCVTSPPYWGLRDYGTATWNGGDLECDHLKPPTKPRNERPNHSGCKIGDGGPTWDAQEHASRIFNDICGKCGARRIDSQIGLEKTPSEYVAKIVEVMREVRRVLKDDGTLWLNLGDSYYNYRPGAGQSLGKQTIARNAQDLPQECARRGNRQEGLKEKDLVGIPWAVAFALRADGWWLRQDIIWAKPNPMPESVTDRCTKAHEYIFMLTKSPRYFYNAAAIRQPASDAMLQQVAEGYDGQATKLFEAAQAQDASSTKTRIINGARMKIDKQRGHSRRHAGFNDRWDHLTKDEQQAIGSNKRSVWTVATNPYSEAHFATFPPDLIKPCILAGSKPGDVILDPFGGSGTAGMVAIELGRKAILIELNPTYAKLIEQRTTTTVGLPF